MIKKYNTEILSAISIATTIALLGVSMRSGISSAEYMSFSASYSLQPAPGAERLELKLALVHQAVSSFEHRMHIRIFRRYKIRYTC